MAQKATFRNVKGGKSECDLPPFILWCAVWLAAVGAGMGRGLS